LRRNSNTGGSARQQGTGERAEVQTPEVPEEHRKTSGVR
jgi:hypothetical protein